MVNETLSPGRLPPGQRVYAIGDVHGCDRQLAALHKRIAADAKARPVPQITLLHLGDYVDRGPDSAAVLERLLAPSPVPGATVVNLLGNHEAMMLEGCEPDATEEAMGQWLQNGGAATLKSYGTKAGPGGEAWAEVPEEHIALLRQLPLLHRAGDYLFVHAGVRPDLPLERQSAMDLLWIREPFLSFEGELPWVVVHGHTPARSPAILRHRIGIDTGACFGGDLTCLVLEGDRLRFLVA
ncbi:serine/threonine protein phosphatase [Siccirubricoccus sp. KC 17139]|uniref:Serine/threonine protein phosphatase n=1 Tax=Siccirubricoccus soli TaxID=2899147 RepID=A0ABT1D0I9_9PROT|nr:metallophosphoesterase family protein [Siccirubricoccus soli]MCO6415417.1 serine/threonine protein phosphatase [Siccirubricoccus soli]MCP2681549.1 serine/threonine protein phosphatase [Siccirubricoccus soli]